MMWVHILLHAGAVTLSHLPASRCACRHMQYSDCCFPWLLPFEMAFETLGGRPHEAFCVNHMLPGCTQCHYTLPCVGFCGDLYEARIHGYGRSGKGTWTNLFPLTAHVSWDLLVLWALDTTTYTQPLVCATALESHNSMASKAEVGAAAVALAATGMDHCRAPTRQQCHQLQGVGGG
jgi:hypothetical protein